MKPFVMSLALAGAMAGPAGGAEPDNRPTLAVLAFQAPRGALTPQEAVDLADDLAARLVDTGRFRVLPREWLPGPPERKNAEHEQVLRALPALRAAAREAGVGHLVIVTLGGPAVPSARATAIHRVGRALVAFGSPRRLPPPCPPIGPGRAPAMLALEVIDVRSGEVVRTSSIRVRPSAATALARTAHCGEATPAGIAADARAGKDFESLTRANADLARVLTLPARQTRAQ